MASRTVLLGIVPVWTLTPPIMTARSMMATRLRVFAAAIAPFWPPGPLPITTRSYSDTLNLRASNSQCQQHWFSPLPGYKHSPGISVLSFPFARKPSPPVPSCQPQVALGSDFGIRSVWSGGTSIPGAFFDWLGEVPGQSPFSDEGSPWHFWLQARAIGSGCGLGSDGAALVVDFAQGGERMCRQLVSAGQGRDRLSHRARSSWAAVRTGCAPRCK